MLQFKYRLLGIDFHGKNWTSMVTATKWRIGIFSHRVRMYFFIITQRERYTIMSGSASITNLFGRFWGESPIIFSRVCLGVIFLVDFDSRWFYVICISIYDNMAESQQILITSFFHLSCHGLDNDKDLFMTFDTSKLRLWYISDL